MTILNISSFYQGLILYQKNQYTKELVKYLDNQYINYNVEECNQPPSLNYGIIFILLFITYIIRNFILGYIMRYFYPNVENNYKKFSIPLIIL